MEHPIGLGVTVPASCANLGPGFDVLAVAVDAHLQVWTTEQGPDRVVSAGEGAHELPTGDDNLVWRSLVAYCERFDTPVPAVSLRVENAIPLERGLGSSAAAAVAGAALGRACANAAGHGATCDQDIIDIAAATEGHADNAAAAVLGGLVVCGDGRARRLEPSSSLRPVLCVPRGRLATEAARGLLPRTVPLADAAANGGRAALVLAGLSGALALESWAMTDVLHEPARFGALPATGALVAALREAGIPACLSGAGPSVLAVLRVDDAEAVQWVRQTAQDLSTDPDNAWEIRPSRWDWAGATASPPSIVPA